MSEPIRLLTDPNHGDGAAPTFDLVEKLLREAVDTIEIFMFVWRSDEIGNRIGRAVLDAADRGVSVKILKDTAAFMYERLEMNRKSFFNVPLPLLTRWKYAVTGWTFPDSFVEDTYDFELGDSLQNHPNVTIQWVNHTHTKYYIVDEQQMVTGSINIEDNHRLYRDYMFEITDAELVQRFRQRDHGSVPYAPDQQVDFLLNRVTPDRHEFEIKPRMVELIDSARETLYIEMAYIGDPDITRSIVSAAQRGVDVTILFSRKANIGDDINWRTLHSIVRQASVNVFISDKMIHSKLMLVDAETVIAGSANFSVFSMQKAAELNVVVREMPTFLRSVRAEIARRLNDCSRVETPNDLKDYNRMLASLQQLHQWLT